VEGQRLFGRATGAFALRDEAPGEQAVALLLDVHPPPPLNLLVVLTCKARPDEDLPIKLKVQAQRYVKVGRARAS
jgi:hypothetical protein